MHKIKELKRGHGFLGPEHYGCCNSGLRPAIYRVDTSVWAIGFEESVRQAWPKIRACRGLKEYPRTINGEQRRTKVLLRKTVTAATKAYEDLCQEVLGYNKEEAQRAKEYQEALRNGNLEKALQYVE